MSRKLSEGCRWDSVHAMHAGFCDWQKGGRKYKQLTLKSEAGLLGMSTEVKGCGRDWNYGKSSKPVSAGKNSRTFGLRGQHLKPCDKGLCPFFSSSKPYTSNCTCGEESTQLPVQLQALCQWHHTVPVAWVPLAEQMGTQRPACARTTTTLPAACATHSAHPAPGWWQAKPGSGWLPWRKA